MDGSPMAPSFQDFQGSSQKMCTSPLSLLSLLVLQFSRQTRGYGGAAARSLPRTCMWSLRRHGTLSMSSRGCRWKTEDPPMVDIDAEEQELGESQEVTSQRPPGKCLAPFLTKTYDLVDRSGAGHIVSWNEEGTAFVVWSPEDLSQFLLPKYFKHCNFSSFIRQLNTYGFRKSAPDRWEFRHEKFQKGKAHLLGEITRRRCEPSVYPSFLRARDKGPLQVEDTRLLEENKILQRENSELLLQIAQYKSLESELTQYLSHFTASNKKARLPS